MEGTTTIKKSLQPLVLVASTMLLGSCLYAADPATSTSSPEKTMGAEISEHRSKHFLIHTDVAQDEVVKIAQRMETSLATAKKFWGKPPRERIECFVIGDLSKWSTDAFPNEDVRSLIQYVGGGTDVIKVTDKRKRSHWQPRVFATATPGVAEHEIVHAYCVSAFGETGPEWFREGMAELASYGADDAEIRCPAECLPLLSKKPRGLSDITNRQNLAGTISDSLARATKHEPSSRTEKWGRTDTGAFHAARASNYWSWALCHLLYHSPNYQKRFRMYGRCQLSTESCQFDRAFGSVKNHIDFELRHFLANAGPGYRVDLCRWDWKTPAKTLRLGETAKVKIKARRGFQASGVVLETNAKYRWSVEGRWRTSAKQPMPVSLDEIEKVEAVAISNFQLSPAWSLEGESSFVAKQDGTLHLRCKDDWTKLADNVGNVTVRVTRIR